MKKKKPYEEPSVSLMLVEAENSFLLSISDTVQHIGLQVDVEPFVYDPYFAPEEGGGYNVSIIE